MAHGHRDDVALTTRTPVQNSAVKKPYKVVLESVTQAKRELRTLVSHLCLIV